LVTKSKTKVRALRVVAVVEATTVTGAAKSLLDFCRAAHDVAPEDGGEPTIETSVVTFTRARGGESNEFIEAARGHGLEVDVIEERFRFDPRAVSELRKVVERRAADVVVTYHVKSHFLARLSGLRRRRAWVAYHHGYTTTDAKMLAYNRLDRLSLPAADRVVTVCEAFARELERARGVAPARLFVLHNSITKGRDVSAEEVARLKERLGLGAGERVVLTIGRLSREKAQADLVRAFGLLARMNTETGALMNTEANVRLVIVGDGPERSALEALAAELGLQERAVFAGQSSDVAPFYALADVFALPSHSEGSPYVLLEALEAGLPVVATSVGGVPEIVADEESALLVAPRDERALAHALARLLSDHALAHALTSNAHTLIATRHAPATYMRSLARLYEEVANASSERANARR
jgi:glycosyltransferase involved in cell wall biosynthesis